MARWITELYEKFKRATRFDIFFAYGVVKSKKKKTDK